MRESKRSQFKGAVLQLGRQDILVDETDVVSMAERERYPLLQAEGPFKEQKSRSVGLGCMNDIKFFKMLGFSTVHSADVSDWEGADFIHDFNLPIPPDSPHRNRYNVICDGGTLEHVFHLPNALKNIYDLLAVDGRVIHQSPADLFNHGFYNFSTCLFEDFYKANGFEVNACAIVTWPYSRHGNARARYVPASSDSPFVRSLCEDTFDGARHLIFFVATKLEGSTGDRIPVQGFYQDAKNGAHHGNSGLVVGDSLLKSAYREVSSVPIVGPLAKYLRDAYARSLVKWDTL